MVFFVQLVEFFTCDLRHIVQHDKAGIDARQFLLVQLYIPILAQNDECSSIFAEFILKKCLRDQRSLSAVHKSGKQVYRYFLHIRYISLYRCLFYLKQQAAYASRNSFSNSSSFRSQPITHNLPV